MPQALELFRVMDANRLPTNSPSPRSRWLPAVVSFALTLVWVPASKAASVIKNDTAHPAYSFEAEPHLVASPLDGGGVGVGFAGTFNIVDRGFIRNLNDSVGVGFGANWTTNQDFVFTGAMQWNFWFTDQWSAFGEPGIAIDTHDGLRVWPHFGAGGRFAFSSNVALTLRVGYPVSSVGVSFFF